MRVGEIVRSVVILLALLAGATVCQGQTADPAVNITAVVRGGVVVVSYDLVSNNPAAEFSITLEASSDGGKTYDVRPRTVKGDVGSAVRAGTSKQITWEASRDVENLALDRYRYRVVARPVSAPPVSAQAPKTLTPPPAQPPPLVQAGGGNGGRWGGIVLMGAGAALAALGATAMKTEECHGCIQKVNTKLVGAGVGVAAGGAVLLMLSRRNDSVGTQIVIDPHGIMVQHRLTFKGIARANRR
jgi:hypothetical protein